MGYKPPVEHAVSPPMRDWLIQTRPIKSSPQLDHRWNLLVNEPLTRKRWECDPLVGELPDVRVAVPPVCSRGKLVCAGAN